MRSYEPVETAVAPTSEGKWANKPGAASKCSTSELDSNSFRGDAFETTAYA